MIKPRLIDLHADTLTALYSDKAQATNDEFAARPVQSLAENSLQIDLVKLKQANSLAQFFVLWLNLAKCYKLNLSPWQHFCKLNTELKRQLALNSHLIAPAGNYAQLIENARLNKISAITCVEEGGFIEDISQLSQAYAMGVRYISLVWNYETKIGVPALIDQQRGLKPFGRELVAKMQELGILVDVSHLSDQGVTDVLAIARQPIIASHSNARAVCDHQRNLPDNLLRGIAESGGVIGVSCVPAFLAANGGLIQIQLLAAHLWHIYQVAGEDVLAIGTDFDGFHLARGAHDIYNIAQLPKLRVELVRCGFSARQIDKIFNQNCLRVIASVLS